MSDLFYALVLFYRQIGYEMIEAQEQAMFVSLGIKHGLVELNSVWRHMFNRIQVLK